MKSQVKDILPLQYITDPKGKKTAVILDIKTFDKLLEKIEDLYLGNLGELALEQDEEFISHEDVKRGLKKSR